MRVAVGDSGGGSICGRVGGRVAHFDVFVFFVGLVLARGCVRATAGGGRKHELLGAGSYIVACVFGF